MKIEEKIYELMIRDYWWLIYQQGAMIRIMEIDLEEFYHKFLHNNMEYKTEEEKLFSGDYISKKEIKTIFDKYIKEFSEDAGTNNGDFEMLLVLRDIEKELKL